MLAKKKITIGRFWGAGGTLDETNSFQRAFRGFKAFSMLNDWSSSGCNECFE
jgi:hypothetical protein